MEKKIYLSLCSFPINMVNIKILSSKCLLQKYVVCRMLNMCLSLFLTPQPFAWLPQFDSVFLLNTSPRSQSGCHPLTFKLWVMAALLSLDISCFSFLRSVDPSWKTDKLYAQFAAYNLKPAHFLFSFFSSSGRQIETQPVERIRMMKSPWQRWWFWESEQSWLSQVSVMSPAPQDIELWRETTKKRYDWDEVCGWGCILPEIGCHLFHEAKLMDRQFFLFLQRHSCTTTGNQVGRGL